MNFLNNLNMYTDINEVNPVTIINVTDNWNSSKFNYMAFNCNACEIPSRHEFYVRIADDGEKEYLSKFDHWKADKIYGEGTTIKEACQDLVRKLNMANSN